MKSRNKTISIVYDSTTNAGCKRSLSRQMTIPEAFKKAKKPSFKMQKFLVSNIIIEIDSDSDEENPQLNCIKQETANDGFNDSDSTIGYDYTGQTFDGSTISHQSTAKSNEKICVQQVITFPKNVGAAENALDSFPEERQVRSNPRRLFQTPDANAKRGTAAQNVIESRQIIAEDSNVNNKKESTNATQGNEKSSQSSNLTKVKVTSRSTGENDQTFSHSKRNSVIIQTNDFAIRETSRKSPVEVQGHSSSFKSSPATVEKDTPMTENPTGLKRACATESEVSHKRPKQDGIVKNDQILSCFKNGAVTSSLSKSSSGQGRSLSQFSSKNIENIIPTTENATGLKRVWATESEGGRVSQKQPKQEGIVKNDQIFSYFKNGAVTSSLSNSSSGKGRSLSQSLSKNIENIPTTENAIGRKGKHNKNTPKKKSKIANAESENTIGNGTIRSNKQESNNQNNSAINMTTGLKRACATESEGGRVSQKQPKQDGIVKNDQISSYFKNGAVTSSLSNFSSGKGRSLSQSLSKNIENIPTTENATGRKGKHNKNTPKKKSKIANAESENTVGNGTIRSNKQESNNQNNSAINTTTGPKKADALMSKGASVSQVQSKQGTIVKDDKILSCSKNEAVTNLKFNRTSPVVGDPEKLKNASPAASRVQQINAVISRPLVDKQTPSTSQSSTTHNTEGTISAVSNKIPFLNIFTPKKCNYGSPVKRTSSKNWEAKNSKAEKAKKSEDKHLNELINLLQMVLKERHLRNILSKDENNVLKRLVDMDKANAYVLLKLYLWERGWYNTYKFCHVDKIKIIDERDMHQIFTYLNMEKLVDNVNTGLTSVPDVADMLRHLTIDQLKKILEDFRVDNEGKLRQELAARIIMTVIGDLTTTMSITRLNMAVEQIKKHLGIAIRIKDEINNILNNIYLMATFINPMFDDCQTYFKNIIEDNVDFPSAPVLDYPVFADRMEFLKYVHAQRLKKNLKIVLRKYPSKPLEIYNIGIEAYQCLKDLQCDEREYRERYMKVPHLKKFSAQHVCCSVLTLCCENIYTRRKGYPTVVKEWLEFMIENYSQSRKLGTWYYRLIWLHMKHLQPIDYQTAAKLLIQVYSNEGHFLEDTDIYKLAYLSHRLQANRANKLDGLSRDRLVILTPPEINVVWTCLQIKLDLSGENQSYFTENNTKVNFSRAEHSALQYYKKKGYSMCEKATLMKSLLLLYFWDIIYNCEETVPGTFISKLQSAPLDMFTPYFYENRRAAINARLKQIDTDWSEEDLVNFGKANYQNHSHEMTAFGIIMKSIKQVDFVGDLVTLIGRRQLVKIFERLIRNIKEFSIGLPDLFFWNTDNKTYKFVKVNNKDHILDANELLWVQYLFKWGAFIEVCWVESTRERRSAYEGDQAEENSE